MRSLLSFHPSEQLVWVESLPLSNQLGRMICSKNDSIEYEDSA